MTGGLRQRLRIKDKRQTQRARETVQCVPRLDLSLRHACTLSSPHVQSYILIFIFIFIFIFDPISGYGVSIPHDRI